MALERRVRELERREAQLLSVLQREAAASAEKDEHIRALRGAADPSAQAGAGAPRRARS